MDYVKIQQEILKSIEVLLQERLKNLSFDYTVDGVITNIINDIEYNVKIYDKEFVIKSINNSVYNIGDVVIVQIRKNNFSDKFILCKRP